MREGSSDSPGNATVKTIGIIGGGVLGRAVARGFMEHADVRVFDVIRERSTHEHLGDVATCDVVFVCLPTPAKPDGTCETGHVEDFLRTARYEKWWKPRSCYVIRSTVPVGFTQEQARLRNFELPLLHSPEFLTARCSIVDFQTPTRSIIGVPQGLHTSDFDPTDDVVTLGDLYAARFPGVPVLTMPSNASELVKLGCNSLFALKVTMFNLLAETAKASGVDWRDVLGGILSDGRIAHAHTAVPGPDGRPGFGGTCLVKDTADLYHCATGLGVDAELLKACLARNEATRRPHDASLAQISLNG